MQKPARQQGLLMQKPARQQGLLLLNVSFSVIEGSVNRRRMQFSQLAR
jgi:hypothetical protein